MPKQKGLRPICCLLLDVFDSNKGLAQKYKKDNTDAHSLISWSWAMQNATISQCSVCSHRQTATKSQADKGFTPK
jgi:hypothetical protein